jgi:hypothetical protein
MKKIIIATLLTVISATALAFAPLPHQTLPWVLITPGDLWKIANPTGTVHVLFTVGPKTSAGTPCDPVVLTCDGKSQTIEPGRSGSCVLSSYNQGQFHIAKFKDGSQGNYTVT